MVDVLGYFDPDDNRGSFTFVNDASGRWLIEAIRQTTEGLLFNGRMSYTTHYYLWQDITVELDLKLGFVRFTVTTLDGNDIDISRRYRGIKVSIPVDATEEVVSILCAFCNEVAKTVRELEAHAQGLAPVTC